MTPMNGPELHDERPEDAEAIDEVQRAAFADHPFSDRTEHLIVRALRTGAAPSVSLVALRAGRLVGHLAFSPVTIAGRPGRWFGLGPLAVRPSEQHAGIGSAIVEAGLQRLRALDAAGCVVFGDPACYLRFGFGPSDGLRLEGMPPEHFCALRLGAAPLPQGAVRYHAAIDSQA